MELFTNLIYECKKGMRDLALYTCLKDDVNKYIDMLKRVGMEYSIVDIGKGKVNIFFGKPECLEILTRFSDTDLNKITSKEDFILGIMLGYSREEQYSRLLSFC